VEVLRASCYDYLIHAGCKRHITPQGAGFASNARLTGPGSLKFVVEAPLRRPADCWGLETGGRLRSLHIRVHLRRVSRCARRLLVITGARCPLTKPAVTAVELQATTEPRCSRGAQPGGIHVRAVQREPAPGGPGSGQKKIRIA
jgi:hypothetical protein